MSPCISGVSHLLLDIEGTTCPVSFVAETLFPYASEHLAGYLSEHRADPAVRELVADVHRHWQDDPDPMARQLRDGALLGGTDGPASGGGQRPGEEDPMAVLPYLRWLIAQDRKVTPLKDLQGRIWEEGYARGQLQGPLYGDVAPALRRWSRQGLVLAVYSSGSVRAQQLLYGHSSAGDLRPLFLHWFDTRSGSKDAPRSYQGICEAMAVPAAQVLFISDAIHELRAADQAGLRVLFSQRPGNPQQDPCGYEAIDSFAAIAIEGPAAPRLR